ncbi:carbon monoxide dehydrogenase [Cryobacterium sp. TMT1-3]|uniref:SRPBCC family protein n=1 Tax=Cryobacterium sp. TMT1-3 TaxID=1259237 RepID=UPI0010696856|nr:SRPBCC family protein [Cryobacterium sp. TMT1-3]TFC25559.1 carbon monoxide dehydrogenase [Cryobacterium sp. TMT1-3]
MQLDSTFTVIAPVDTVWTTLMDFERVAGCVPGAQILNRLSDDNYQVGMKVKLGPVTMAYRGQMNVDERDAEGHRAVFSGKAQETRGQGTAQATVTLVLVETDGVTQGTVSADLSLSGKAAAMGKGVISSVTDQMMALFAANLQDLIEGGDSDSVGGPAAATPVGDHVDDPATLAQAAPRAVTDMSDIPPGDAPAADTLPGVQADAPPQPGLPPRPVPPRVAPAGGHRAAPNRSAPHLSHPAAAPSLDAMSLVKGVITDQLSDPVKLLGLLATVAFIAYRIGRRASGR